MEILVFLGGFGRRENKANSKPNKANMPSFGRKSEVRIPKSETDRMDAKRQIPAHFKECVLKKQSQLLQGQNDVKSILIMVYGDFDGPMQRENKANSKPIYLVLSTA